MILRGKGNMIWPKSSRETVPLDSLEVGTLVKIALLPEFASLLGESILFRVADIGYPSYPEGSVTLVSDRAVLFGSYDAREPTNPIQYRQAYGNNRYPYSNVHQWLNSADPAGSWYTPSHPYDHPPQKEYTSEGRCPYAHLPGFFGMLPPRLRSSILDTTLKCVTCPEDGGQLDVFTAKIFLPSVSETGAYSEGIFPEERTYAIFPNRDSRVCSLTEEAIALSGEAHGDTVQWFTRSPDRTSLEAAYGVNNRGNRVFAISCNPWGIRPAFNLPGTARVTVETDDIGEILP